MRHNKNILHFDTTMRSVALLVLTQTTAFAWNASDQPLTPSPCAVQPISSLGQYQKFEAAFTLPHQSGNPFDPSVNKIDVVFQGPKATSVAVPAFWDGNIWKVRFSPSLVGRYTLWILDNGIKVRPLTLTSGKFVCKPGNSPGYLHLAKGDTQHFVFDNGTGYYPIGLNQAWTGKRDLDYPTAFAKMRGAHLNYARVWMTFWDQKALDWAPKREYNPPAGYFYLPAARRMDMVMDSAEQNGIYIQLCLQHHGQYTATTDSDWADNPANRAIGGYLASPADFFTDENARRLTRAKYRYIVARWGYSTHLMSYELFNEVQNIGEMKNHMDAVGDWHREMARAIRTQDYAHHLITTSMADDVLSNASIDYDQLHIYSSAIGNSVSEIGGTRPVFAGEFGPGGGNWGYDEMKLAVLHDGLWSGLTAPAAGAPQFWYWDVISDRNWWSALSSAARFYETSGAAAERSLSSMRTVFKSSDRLKTLAFSLPDSWATAKQSETTVGHDGASPSVGGMTAFIQGSNHREMMPKPFQFNMDSRSGTTLRVNIGTAARMGSHATLLLDGVEVAHIDYPATDADRKVEDALTVNVPAGRHNVTLGNSGFDWYKVSTISLTNYAPPTPYRVQAKGNDHFALFWISAISPAGEPSAEMMFHAPTLKDGEYVVHFWSTANGIPIGAAQTAIFKNGLARVSLPAVNPDIAGWVSRSTPH